MIQPAASRAAVVTTLIVGTFAVSTAAPFITLAEMHPLALTAGRLLGASLLYACIGRDFISQWRALSRVDKRRLAIATPFLTGHFVCWISAFSYTDLPSAVLLLVLQPLFASWIGARVFRERITPSVIGAIVCTLTGLAIITVDDLRMSPSHLFGNLLVALGVLFIIVFLSFGKSLRPKLSFSAWMTLSYGGAGLWAALLMVATGVPAVGYEPAAYGWLLGLIFITTGVGHAALNWVLPYVRLFTVNLVTVAEPLIAIAAAILFLGEVVTPAEIAGGALLCAAMFIGMRDEWRNRRPVTEVAPG